MPAAGKLSDSATLLFRPLHYWDIRMKTEQPKEKRPSSVEKPALKERLEKAKVSAKPTTPPRKGAATSWQCD
jgi:hypothetical protein